MCFVGDRMITCLLLSSQSALIVLHTHALGLQGQMWSGTLLWTFCWQNKHLPPSLTSLHFLPSPPFPSPPSLPPSLPFPPSLPPSLPSIPFHSIPFPPSPPLPSPPLPLKQCWQPGYWNSSVAVQPSVAHFSPVIAFSNFTLAAAK